MARKKLRHKLNSVPAVCLAVSERFHFNSTSEPKGYKTSMLLGYRCGYRKGCTDVRMQQITVYYDIYMHIFQQLLML